MKMALKIFYVESALYVCIWKEYIRYRSEIWRHFSQLGTLSRNFKRKVFACLKNGRKGWRKVPSGLVNNSYVVCPFVDVLSLCALFCYIFSIISFIYDYYKRILQVSVKFENLIYDIAKSYRSWKNLSHRNNKIVYSKFTVNDNKGFMSVVTYLIIKLKLFSKSIYYVLSHKCTYHDKSTETINRYLLM